MGLHHIPCLNLTLLCTQHGLLFCFWQFVFSDYFFPRVVAQFPGKKKTFAMLNQDIKKGVPFYVSTTQQSVHMARNLKSCSSNSFKEVSQRFLRAFCFSANKYGLVLVKLSIISRISIMVFAGPLSLHRTYLKYLKFTVCI